MLVLLDNKAVCFVLCLCFVRMRKTSSNSGEEIKTGFLKHCISVFPLIFPWGGSLIQLSVSLMVSSWVRLLSNEKATVPLRIHRKQINSVLNLDAAHYTTPTLFPAVEFQTHTVSM